MERKVGEIFEYNGEWYQCVECDSCGECSLRTTECGSGTKSDIADEVFGKCSKVRRSNSKSVIFKKLEKIGEPTMLDGKLVQKILTTDGYSCNGCCFKSPECDKADDDLCCKYEIYVEIKQNKENMEEETKLPKEDNALTRTVHDYVNGKISDKELIKSIKEMSDEYPYIKDNLKPFDLEAAKAGKPVCTRDGRKARIICFDAKCNKPIVALIYDCNKETVLQYLENGRFFVDQIDKYDLMMFPQKKEGWVNVYKSYNVGKKIPCMASIYPTKEEAKKSSVVGFDYVDTVKIEWEE